MNNHQFPQETSNKNHRYTIVNILPKDFKQLLYKDEIGDPFVLTKFMEIYLKSSHSLGCSCWSKRIFTQLQKTGLIFNEWRTDDKLFTFETDLKNLELLIKLGSHSRRFHRHGIWLIDKEERLGHKITPFNPQFQGGEDE